MSEEQIVEVITFSGFDKALAYKVPDHAFGSLQVGSLVKVPLRNRSEVGIVSQIGTGQVIPKGKLKFIYEVINKIPALTPDLLKLAKWLGFYYNASPESVFEAMIPLPIRKGMDMKVEKLIQINPDASQEAIANLIKRAPKQADLLEFLKEQKTPIPKNKTLESLKISPSSCDGLIKKGLILETSQQDERIAYEDTLSKAEAVENTAHKLNEEQANAVDGLEKLIDEKAFKVALLHGITGSGKTEVYLSAMKKVLKDGGGVIFLVPEVALAPQTVGRIRSRFKVLGEKVVVWHSQLSNGERYDSWLAVRQGEARIVVGARSAIFAPIPNLKLIIVDEEHEPAFKQEDTPRYNGRDVAVYRSMLSNCLCLLGSATPSLESLYNVTIKKYNVLKLKKRVDDRQIPRIDLIDMRREKPRPNTSGIISNYLAEKLLTRFELKEQSILFLNRRGYSSSMICPECGHVESCEHCSLTLTYHKKIQKLKCHTCNFEKKAPTGCPHCKFPKIRLQGSGTQRVEEAVRNVLPHAKIVRIDADTMVKKDLYREILSDFRRGKIDILIGTQMIAKGLDFPNVTLVGLINADLSLHISDFRAAERTFQLLVQVSGRAGRGDRAGEVVVQTLTPHSPPIQYARRSDFDGFLEEELAMRKEFNYPPYRHLIRHIFKGKNAEKVEFYAEQWADHIDKHLGEQLEIRGPAPAPLEKIKDDYRFHLWYFVDSVTKQLPKILEHREKFPFDAAVINTLDIDPMNVS